jgi:hypothetical protein
MRHNEQLRKTLGFTILDERLKWEFGAVREHFPKALNAKKITAWV